MKPLNEQEQTIAKRTEEVWELARAIYKLDDIDFTLKFSTNKQLFHAMKRTGRRGCQTVGYAQLLHTGLVRSAVVTFNRNAIEQNFTDMFTDTIPHEVAHIVCFLKPELGTKHDDGWSKVCRRLGGTGEAKYRAGMYELRQRIRWRYWYEVNGRRFHIPDYKHNDIQEGRPYYIKATGEKILAEHWTGEKK